MRKVWDTNELVCLSNINSHVDWTQKKKNLASQKMLFVSDIHESFEPREGEQSGQRKIK